jgi:aquaporin Z
MGTRRLDIRGLDVQKVVGEAVGTARLVFFAVGTATLCFGFGTAGQVPAARVVVTALAFGLVSTPSRCPRLR